MRKSYWVLFVVIALLIAAAVPAFAAPPNFGKAIYADDEVWGTKGNADLPAPNDHNRQSFDGLYKFIKDEDGEKDFPDPVEGQLAVAEAAPGNPAYNGGRWIEYEVNWNKDEVPVLVTSYEQLMELHEMGKVSIEPTGNYFQCPLLPAKDA